jgi:hypothetical protein
MKYLKITGMLVLLSFTGSAVAGACYDEGYETNPDGVGIAAALSDKRVAAAGPSGDSPWHEDHCATTENTAGALYKVACGDGSCTAEQAAVDPRAFRGTWVPGTVNPGTSNGASGCAPGFFPETEFEPPGPPACLAPPGLARGTVQYHYTVTGNSIFTWDLFVDETGGICWENQSDDSIVAEAPAPGSAGSPCNIP